MENRGAEELIPFYGQIGLEGVVEYWKRRNTVSIDGMATGILDDD